MRNRTVFTNAGLIAFIAIICGTRPIDASSIPEETLEKVWSVSLERITTTARWSRNHDACTRDGNCFPRYVDENGDWRLYSQRSWTSGFFPGCVWFAFEKTQDTTLRDEALIWTGMLEEMQYFTGNHDIGFIMMSSYGHALRLTGDTSFIPYIIQSAQSLASRFDSITGCTMSWNPNWKWQFPVIIDNMMNLELLFRATQLSGDSTFFRIAMSHARKTAENHIRLDGSTHHVVDYDPETGEVVQKLTHQGLLGESTWSRGQAWGLYGFTMAYRESGEILFLETAKRLADYYVRNLPELLVPYWDFKAADYPFDASAAAIATAGLLELSTLVRHEPLSLSYWMKAVNMLNRLCSDWIMEKDSLRAGIIQHSTGSKPHNKEVDVALIYGDYYFLEALLRYEKYSPQFPDMPVSVRRGPGKYTVRESVPASYLSRRAIYDPLGRTGADKVRGSALHLILPGPGRLIAAPR